MLNLARTGAKRCFNPQTMATLERVARRVMNPVNRFIPPETRMALQKGTTTGVKVVNGALMLTTGVEALNMARKKDPETGKNMVIFGKQFLCNTSPQIKYWIKTLENLNTCSKSFNEIVLNDKISDDEKCKTLLDIIKKAIVSQLKMSNKCVKEFCKLTETKEEITKIVNSKQFDKEAVKNCCKKLIKLYCSNLGTLIDATTLPERWLRLLKDFGAEELFENYSQTDIDADGQISLGVPGLESNKDDVDKQNTVSDTKKQEQKSDSDVVVKVKVTDSDPLEQAKELEPISESKNSFLSIIIDNFQQAEGFPVNEEGDVDRLKEMSEHPDLPRTQEVSYRTLAMMSKYAIKNMVYKFETYSPIDVDIDGHEVLGIWVA